MKRLRVTLLWVALTSMVSAQKIQHVDALNCDVYTIVASGDSISFCKIGDNLTPKPVIVWCPGSTPQPLLVQRADSSYFYGCIPDCDWKSIACNFHIIVIGNPFVPPVVQENQLNDGWAYVTDTDNPHSYPQDYLKANYLDNYIRRGNAVINYLCQQDWTTAIYVVGHSQGSKVAVSLAQNGHVKAVGALSINPLGRVDEFVRRARQQALEGKISDEEAQKQIDQTYRYWQEVCDTPTKESERGEDSHKTTYSFSTPTLDILLSLNIPIYIAYGTRDVTARYCDLLPIDFIRAKKQGWKVVPYLNMEHNFAVVKPNGEVDWDDYHFPEVVNGFVQWLIEMESDVEKV